MEWMELLLQGMLCQLESLSFPLSLNAKAAVGLQSWTGPVRDLSQTQNLLREKTPC